MTDQEAELGQITDQGAASTSPFNFQSAVEKQKQLSPPPKNQTNPKIPNKTSHYNLSSPRVI